MLQICFIVHRIFNKEKYATLKELITIQTRLFNLILKSIFEFPEVRKI